MKLELSKGTQDINVGMCLQVKEKCLQVKEKNLNNPKIKKTPTNKKKYFGKERVDYLNTSEEGKLVRIRMMLTQKE